MFDLEQSIRTIGLWGVFAVVFAETGLLIGFFLPGDSLLFTAGFLASQGVFDIHALSHGCFVAAVLGNITGYAFGHRVGRKLFERPDSRFFKQAHLVKAHAFYEKYGARALVLARFIPVVRVFAPIVAGVGLMDYRKFMFFNLLGGALWAYGMTWLGYFLGSRIPGVDRYLLPIIGLILVLSVLPAVIHVWQDPEHRAEIQASLRRLFRGR
ncbi:MAG: VTT domain-containing protein [Candidatus Eisenbacteria bacterium]